jgi:hypothetical protein
MAVGDTNLTNLVLSGDLTVGDDAAISGDLAVTGALTAATVSPTTAIVGAKVNTAVSRQRAVIQIAGGSTIADGTTYKQLFSVGRALTVNRLLVGANVKPVGGTNTLKILKNGASGNTMLNAATFDPTTITANDTVEALTLTSTAADLALDANDSVYIEWAAGTQTTDAQAAIVIVEYTVTDL